MQVRVMRRMVCERGGLGTCMCKQTEFRSKENSDWESAGQDMGKEQLCTLLCWPFEALRNARPANQPL